MEALITVFDWRRQWLTVVCSISSIIWAEDTNWRPGWPDPNNTPHQEEKQHQGDLDVICWEEEITYMLKHSL